MTGTTSRHRGSKIFLYLSQNLTLRFDVASYVRGSPSREASGGALLARSLVRHNLCTLHGDGDGCWNERTEWQLSCRTRHARVCAWEVLPHIAVLVTVVLYCHHLNWSQRLAKTSWSCVLIPGFGHRCNLRIRKQFCSGGGLPLEALAENRRGPF